MYGTLFNMEKRYEYERETVLVPFQSNRWQFEGCKKGDILIIEALLHEEGFDDLKEHSEYVPLRSKEIQGPFYVKIDEKSTEGSLPHGDACYLKAWDVVLLQPEVVDQTSEKLSRKTYTILAHELGHQLAYKKGLAKEQDAPDFNYNEDELLAWQMAIETYGENDKFDHSHAQHCIEDHRKQLEEEQDAT